MDEHTDDFTEEEKWLIRFAHGCVCGQSLSKSLSSALHDLGVDKKIGYVEAAGQQPTAILMPDKSEFSWVRAIITYRDLPVQFAPVITEPEVAYRYVELSKEDEDESE